MKSVVVTLLCSLLMPLVLAGCGAFRKEEVGPYADKRSRWEKLRTYEDERYDDWFEKWAHRDRWERAKREREKRSRTWD